MHRIYNIAILECDTLADVVVKSHGSYGELYERLIRKGLAQLPDHLSKLELRFTKWDVVKTQSYPDPEQVDVVLLSGSKHDAWRNDSWILSLTDYVRDVLSRSSTKVIGLCFGHQILARAAGAEVGRSSGGWEVSVNTFDLSQIGAKLFDGKSKLTLHQMHRDQALTLPKGFSNLGQSDRCSIQGLYAPGKALSLQAHPEFNADIISKIVGLRHEQGLFDDEFTADALARAHLASDDGICAQAMCRFMTDG